MSDDPTKGESSHGSEPLLRATDDRRGLTVMLTRGQELELLLQIAGEDEARDWLLTRVEGMEQLRAVVAATWRERHPESSRTLSRSLLRGLSILGVLWPPGTERGIIDIAGALKLSPSTTHRYAATLVELGLVERVTSSRRYRLPLDKQEHHADE